MASLDSGALKQIDRLFRSGAVEGLNDAQLVERFAARGDEAAFAALAARHGPTVLAACRGVLRDPNDIDDAFQAVFLVLARKAGSIRVDRTLAPWLHRVAFRVALSANADAARRRRHEVRAAGSRPATTGPAEPDDDLGAIVRAEVARLPEPLRLPVLLCDLEGLTRPEAAARLNWTEATLRGRLARARDRLRDRLARRGLAGAVAGGLAVAIAPAARAALSPTLLESTVRAGVASAAGRALTLAGGAAALASEVLRSMLMQTLRRATLATLTLGLLGWGLATALARPGDPKPRRPEDPKPDVAAQAKPEPGETITYHGRVLGPDGQPVAGAAIRMVTNVPQSEAASPIEPRATSAKDGTFRFEVPRDDFGPEFGSGTSKSLRVVASAPGFGVGWATQASAGEAGDLAIRLAEDCPITGRILDLEGRPVAGADVRVSRIDEPLNGTLDSLGDLLARPAPGRPRSAGALLLVPALGIAPTTTDAEGRFEIRGAGRERIARLTVRGDGIATEELTVLTRPGIDVAKLDELAHGLAPRSTLGETYRGPSFDYVASPAFAVVGVVRDAGTGAPLRGVRISLLGDPNGRSTAVTDDQGRYRLAGVAKGGVVRLYAYPEGGKRYLQAVKTLPPDPGLDAVTLDWSLTPGVTVRGRVADAKTGEPLDGAVGYEPLAGNEAVLDPAIGDVYRSASPAESSRQGRFEIVVPPGLGLVTFLLISRDPADRGRYLPARVGQDERVKPFPGRGGDEGLVGAFGSMVSLRNSHACAVIEPEPGQESVEVELKLVLGLSRTVRVVGPDSEAVADVRVNGAGGFLGPAEMAGEDGTFEATALDPDHPRTVVGFGPGARLAGSLVIRGDEGGDLELRLQPAGSVSGRLVDEDGEPVAEASINAYHVLGDVGVSPRTNPGATDAEGRFRVEGFVPGLPASLTFRKGQSYYLPGEALSRLILEPGEDRDLGDVKAKAVRIP
jgi:RNA polymerase sigma factor (sigma-70 family)